LKRTSLRIATVATAIVAMVAIGTPAQAFPSLPDGPPTDCTACPPSSGPTLFVHDYYSDANMTNLVGQSWFGCPGVPRASWGRTTAYDDWHFVSCN
jgi:hypothetical protein